MKRIITPVLFFVLVLVSFSAKAGKHTITVGDFAFSPSTLSLPLGDTVIYQWVTGSHTTTSTNIPSGATTWDSPLNSSATTFMYVPAVTGTYNYKCTPHESMGMVGTFDVTNPTNVPAVPPTVNQLIISPNPASSVITVNSGLKDASVQLYDAVGRFIKQLNVSGSGAGQMTVNVADVATGVYILKIVSGAQVQSVRFTVAR